MNRSLTSASMDGPIEKVRVDDCIEEVKKYVADPTHPWWNSWLENYKVNVIRLNEKKKRDYYGKYVKMVKESLLAENALIQFRYDSVPRWLLESKSRPCSLTNHNNFLTLVRNELKFKQDDPLREPTDAEIMAAWKEKEKTTNIPIQPITELVKKLERDKQLSDREDVIALRARFAAAEASEKVEEKKRQEKPALFEEEFRRRGIGGAPRRAVEPPAQQAATEDFEYKKTNFVDECFEENETFMTDEKNVKVEEYQKSKSASSIFLTLIDLATTQIDHFKNFEKQDVYKLMTDILGLFAKIRGKAREAVKQTILYEVYKLGFPGLTQSSQEPFLNIALFGKAGTGKTVVAKLISQVYGMSGLLLYDGIVKEYTAKDLTGSYLGQSGKIMFEKLINGLEQVVFIDEAYSIVACEKDPETKKKVINQNASTYGLESIAEMLKFTDEYRGKQVVIVAGYRGDMDSCFFGANEGLPRRFPIQLDLLSYDTTGLMEIFMLNINADANKMNVDIQTRLKAHIVKMFDRAVAEIDPNGRNSDTLFKYQGGDMLNLGQAFMDKSNQQKIATHRKGEGYANLDYRQIRFIFDEIFEKFFIDRKEFIENTKSPVQKGQVDTIRRLKRDFLVQKEGGTRKKRKKTKRRFLK
jgi:hypothetical protein